MTNGIYVGEVCSNADLITSHANLLASGEDKWIEDAMTSQLGILKIKDPAKVAEILKIIEQKPINSWNYIDNLKEKILIENQKKKGGQK